MQPADKAKRPSQTTVWRFSGLVNRDAIEIVGRSTVFGNTPLTDIDRITRVLAATLIADQGRSIPVHRSTSCPSKSLEAGIAKVT